MQLCDDGHGEVAFAGSWQDDCPACKYAEEIRDEMESEIKSLKDEVYNHECE